MNADEDFNIFGSYQRCCVSCLFSRIKFSRYGDAQSRNQTSSFERACYFNKLIVPVIFSSLPFSLIFRHAVSICVLLIRNLFKFTKSLIHVLHYFMKSTLIWHFNTHRGSEESPLARYPLGLGCRLLPQSSRLLVIGCFLCKCCILRFYCIDKVVRVQEFFSTSRSFTVLTSECGNLFFVKVMSAVIDPCTVPGTSYSQRF